MKNSGFEGSAVAELDDPSATPTATCVTGYPTPVSTVTPEPTWTGTGSTGRTVAC